jgi:hypothetical protein
MRKSNSIVRTITINGNPNNPKEMHYKIDFMTFSKALSKENPHYKFMHQTFKIYPYKWYDIRWIYEIPSYWFLLRVFRIDEHKISTAKHNVMSITVLITEILTTIKSVKELINLFI